jgi:hypothetical protein
MTEERDVEEITEAEEQAIQAALEALTPGWSAETETEVRTHVELLGLLPQALVPVVPRPEVKQELFRRIGAESDGSRISAGGQVVPFAGRGAEQSAAERASAHPSVDPSVATVATGHRPPAWLLPLAAALAFATVALAGTVGWLTSQLNDQRQTLAELSDRIHQGELAQEKLALVTDRGTEICRLGPHGEAPEQPTAYATFYAAPDRKSWVLAADNLEPCDQGNRYQVWFMTDAGVVSGGVFFVKQRGKIEIKADQMPEGTKAIMVTLESEERSEPTGPMILYGDEPSMVI